MTALVVLGANNAVATEAAMLGVDVVHVLLPGVTGSPGARVLHTDYRRHDEFVAFIDAVLRPLNPAAVVSLTELGLEPAAIASERLGTPGVPLDVVKRTRNKFSMREVLQERAPHLNPPYALAADAEAVDRLFAGGRAVIAKPVDGAGSTDIALLLEQAELPAAQRTSGVLLEGYIGGVEYSIECLSRAGQHTILGIAEKGLTSGFIESSHVMPPAMLDESDRELLEGAVAQLLDALELSDGPSHTEIKLDAGRPVVIETHNRLGGDGIADLVWLTSGVNWRRAALGWPLGIGTEVEKVTAPAAAMVFFTAPPGRAATVIDMPTLDGATIVDWRLQVAPGDVVQPLRSSAGRLGFATITAPDPASCLAAVARLTSMQIVTTEPYLPVS